MRPISFDQVEPHVCIDINEHRMHNTTSQCLDDKFQRLMRLCCLKVVTPALASQSSLLADICRYSQGNDWATKKLGTHFTQKYAKLLAGHCQSAEGLRSQAAQ